MTEIDLDSPRVRRKGYYPRQDSMVGAPFGHLPSPEPALSCVVSQGCMATCVGVESTQHVLSHGGLNL